MRKYNYIVAVIMMALSGYILYEASTYEIGQTVQKNPAIWPQFLAISLIALSVALIIQTILSRDPELDKFVIEWKSEGMKKVYIMFGFTIGFVIVMKIFGMLIALLVLIPAIEWLMGCKNKKMMIIFPIGLVAFVYLFFVVIMKLSLPAPFWA